jgi:glycosyltransferase involved in cell wall biosynthesis
MPKGETPLRVLIVHNRYASTQPSGENRVVEDDIESLRTSGVDLSTYIRDSDEISEMPLWERATLPLRPTYSTRDARALTEVFQTVRPQVVHLHNVFPLISPYVVRIARKFDTKVVQTVHNYRHVCPSGIRFRDGHPCDDCVGRRVAIPAIRHGCYRGSHLGSTAMVLSSTLHRGTWRLVDRYLPVGPDVAIMLAAIGIPRDRITVRRNELPTIRPLSRPGKDVAFIGRLSPEKGITLLLEAWKSVGRASGRTLHVAGAGPLTDLVAGRCAEDPTTMFHGLLTQTQVEQLIDACALVVVPSLWPEPDPITAIAALAAGRPILATRLGALAHDLTNDSGWLVEPTVGGLASGLTEALSDEAELARRGQCARENVIRDPGRAANDLLDIYRNLLDSGPSDGRAGSGGEQ